MSFLTLGSQAPSSEVRPSRTITEHRRQGRRLFPSKEMRNNHVSIENSNETDKVCDWCTLIHSFVFISACIIRLLDDQIKWLSHHWIEWQEKCSIIRLYVDIYWRSYRVIFSSSSLLVRIMFKWSILSLDTPTLDHPYLDGILIFYKINFLLLFN